MLGSRGIDGILCMSVEDDISHLVQFQKSNKVPIVLMNRDFLGDVSCVSVDNEYGGYLMAKYLLDMGHRKIAGMFGDFSRQRFRARYNGCKRAMEEYEVENYKKYFIYDVNTIEEAFRCTKEVLISNDRPTAFFASLDILAIGIYSGIREIGLEIPREVSVVGYDNIFMTQYMTPPLTTYNAPIDELAKRSVECLIDQIEDRKSCERIIMKGNLIERKSAYQFPAE
jgi:DNA-binding LacI/PurR family transcriptional regulator